MKIKQYQVDAFARRVFEGNPAAVCPLDVWLKDEILQSITPQRGQALNVDILGNITEK